MRLFPILYSFIITFFLAKHKCFTAFSLSVYRFFSHIKRAVFSRPLRSSCPSRLLSLRSLLLSGCPFRRLFFFRQFVPSFRSPLSALFSFSFPFPLPFSCPFLPRPYLFPACPFPFPCPTHFSSRSSCFARPHPTPFKTNVPENKPVPFSECQGLYSVSGI